MTTPLARTLTWALTAEWQSVQDIRNAIATRQYRPALSEVAATLRQLRRDGVAESESRGTDGKAWRKAGVQR